MSAARAALVLVAAATLVGPAAAQTAPASLAGIQGRAAATGVAVAYRPEGLLPIASPVDLSAPDALATIASGPSTFARAGVADPGDLLANPDAVIALADPSWPSGTIPSWPLRVTATSGVGEPVVESNPAPGLDARAEVEASGSRAQARMPFLAAPAIATAGSITSEASTATDGATVTVRARSEVSELDLLGLLRIESIVSDVSATSDGTDTVLTGGTTVAGATLLGQPVTIDASGVHAGPPSGPSGPSAPLALPALDDLLAGLGITVTVLGPSAQDGEAAGQLAAGGLRIELAPTDDARAALGELAALLPPIDVPGVEDVLAAAQARHLVTIELARGFVSLTARAAPAPSPAGPAGPGAAPVPSPGAGSLVGATPSPSAPIGAAPPSAGAPPAVAPAQAAAATTLAGGIGALTLLALAAQPFAGARLAALAGVVLAPGAGGSCAREERT